MTEDRNPLLYQLNARLRLADLSRELGRPATLDDLSDSELDVLAESRFTYLYLLGVWQTGEAGREVSRTTPEWQEEFRAALPDLTEEDICGSPFAITGYAVPDACGGDAALARFRARLRERGLRLILDFVPNHTGLDHPWVRERPDCYVHGTHDDLDREPANYVSRPAAGDRPLILAHGRDPYFPGWPDTLQLNYGEAALHDAMRAELLRVADRCDGVRCDMAMLLLPDVFERTWGISAEPFWPEAIAGVRHVHPEFLFLAEVYWDLEWELQQQGFDLTYDKKLYDRLRDGRAVQVGEHLRADLAYQQRLARFLENHDESRAAAIFEPEIHRAAAAICYLAPGLRFFHQGQFEGRRTRVPMHLCRAPHEPMDPAVQDLYAGLLRALRTPAAREGEWRLLEPHRAWEENPTAADFVAFSWAAGDNRLLMVANYSPHQSQCYVSLPFPDLVGRLISLRDLIGPSEYDRSGTSLVSPGLYLDLPAWGVHVFDLVSIGED